MFSGVFRWSLDVSWSSSCSQQQLLFLNVFLFFFFFFATNPSWHRVNEHIFFLRPATSFIFRLSWSISNHFKILLLWLIENIPKEEFSFPLIFFRACKFYSPEPDIASPKLGSKFKAYLEKATRTCYCLLKSLLLGRCKRQIFSHINVYSNG